VAGPNNGQRRHEAGSITVVDLIRRQQGPVRVLSADEEATVRFVDDLLGGPTDEPGHHGWLARGARLAGLALGSLALCGSVYAASTFAHHRPPQMETADSSPATTVLTGVGALRPDTVAEQLSGSGTAHPGKSHVPAGTAGRATGTIVGHPMAAAPTAKAASAPPSGHPLVVPSSPAAVVRAFYQLAATDPSLAAQLVAPSLLSTDVAGFDEAWSSMAGIEVESVEQMSSTAVQAVVRMLEPDGTWLQVVELLHVTGGDTPLISGAELLSAQHG
jgi:hypothetical protein